MGKITIECLDRKINIKDICSAVYNVLGQKDNFKVEVLFYQAEEMQKLNAETRNVDKVTDVLSYPSLDGIRNKVIDKKDFPWETEGKYILLGSIVLCEDKIRAQAEEYGHSYETEMQYLIIHGLLHLFGYDHILDEDKKEMRTKEKAVLKVLGVEDN